MKKLIKLAATCAVVSALMTGCKSDYTQVSTGSDFRIIAMKDTGVLYYRGTYTIAPYISENGKFCKLVDGKIVEIDEKEEK